MKSSEPPLITKGSHSSPLANQIQRRGLFISSRDTTKLGTIEAMAKPKDQTVHHLKVTLTDWEGRVKGMPYRTIAIESGDSLYSLAEAINDAYGFDFDHAFGFFDNLKNPYNSRERYELFTDLEEEDSEEGFNPLEMLPDALSAMVPGGENNPAFWVTKAAMELDQELLKQRYLEATRAILREELLKSIPSEKHRQVQEALSLFIEQMMPDEEDLEEDLALSEGESKGVKGVSVAEAFPKVGKKLLFLFDYGDEWHFIVELKESKTAKGDFPRVVESVGQAPSQYGDEDE